MDTGSKLFLGPVRIGVGVDLLQVDVDGPLGSEKLSGLGLKVALLRFPIVAD
jgi:hypothetical protein